MTRYIFLALLATMIWSCKSEAQTDDGNQPAGASSSADSILYTLICKDITQPEDKIKHHDVYAVVDNDTAKVGTIEDCLKIDPSDFEKYEIPSDAFEAVGGTGPDNVTYVVYIGKSKEGKITARIGNKYPGKPSGSFDYRSMVVFNPEDITPGAEVSPGALAGSYVHSGETNSYVLFLGFNNRTLMGQLFTLDGPLPEGPDGWMTAISETKPEVLNNVEVDFSDLSFSSLKGPGKFNSTGGRVESISFAKLDKGKPVELEKKN